MVKNRIFFASSKTFEVELIELLADGFHTLGYELHFKRVEGQYYHSLRRFSSAQFDSAKLAFICSVNNIYSTL